MLTTTDLVWWCFGGHQVSAKVLSESSLAQQVELLTLPRAHSKESDGISHAYFRHHLQYLVAWTLQRITTPSIDIIRTPLPDRLRSFETFPRFFSHLETFCKIRPWLTARTPIHLRDFGHVINNYNKRERKSHAFVRMLLVTWLPINVSMSFSSLYVCWLLSSN